MSHSLNSVCIKGFKSILDTTLDLGKVNILIGENGAGKSNILEAIGMLSAAVSGQVDYARLRDRGVRMSAPEVFKSAFKNSKRKKDLRFEVTLDNGKYSYAVTLVPKRENNSDLIHYDAEKFWEIPDSKKLFIASRSNAGATLGKKSLSKPQPNRSILLTDEVVKEIPSSVAEVVEALSQFAIYAPFTPILRGISPDESNKAPLGLYGGSLAQSLAAILETMKPKDQTHILLNSIFELLPWVSRFGYNSPPEELASQHIHLGSRAVSFIDRRMSEKFNNLLSYDVSEGALYILFFYVLLLHKNTPPILAIDNIDSALNPRMSERLMIQLIKIIKKEERKQLLITTHNPQALNGIDLFDDDVRLFVVERDAKTGGTSTRRINPIGSMTRDKWNEVMEGRTLAELWMSGALGALPNI